MNRPTATPSWRLITDAPCDGAWNMAVDRSIQIGRQEGTSPPTLRLYRWVRPTVSLGRFQSVEDVDAAICRELGVGVVRRHTGGRGVLHDDEVTYSCVASVSDGVPRGVSASYRFLCRGLLAAYAQLGVPAELTARARGSRDSAACYLHTSRADVSISRSKLSGSAQVWYRDTVLQHGSFVLSRDGEREARIFRLTERDRNALEATTETLSTLGIAVEDTGVFCGSIAAGWEVALGICLEPGSLTESELERAEALAATARARGLAEVGASQS
ncbi:MAG: lipoate--protein ligase family protein [Coriobacteriia bacterium]|nr:lipoate--protein ligase family protein [Coriobacteriia bacterium]